jgi:5S rRNA maturation endonuclease (ribonuclease M5)
MDYKKSIEEIEKALIDLIENNKRTPIVVEGEKDIEALRILGVTGEIIGINRGVSLTSFSDDIANNYKEIIILTDWDRKGGFICHTIKRLLEGRVICNLYYRELFSKNSTIKTVEGLPSWIETMKDRLND